MSEEIDYFKDENFVLEWRKKLDFDIFTGNYFYEKNFPINFSRLEKVTIKNFKSIKNQTISLDELTLITGYNSSGKSSVSHFIVLLLQWIAGISKSEINREININGPMIKLGDFKEIINRSSNKEDIEICLYFKTNLGKQVIDLKLVESDEEKGRFRVKIKEFSKKIIIEKKEFSQLETLQQYTLNKQNSLLWEDNFIVFINKLLDNRITKSLRKSFYQEDFIASDPEQLVIEYKLNSQGTSNKFDVENRMLLGNSISKFYLEEDYAEQNFPENLILDSRIIGNVVSFLTAQIQINDIDGKSLDEFFTYVLFPKAYLNSKKNTELPSGVSNQSYFNKPYTMENSVIVSGKKLLKYRIISELKAVTSGIRNDIDTYNSFRSLVPLEVLSNYHSFKRSPVGIPSSSKLDELNLFNSYLKKYINKNLEKKFDFEEVEKIMDYLIDVENTTLLKEKLKEINKTNIQAYYEFLKIENNFDDRIYSKLIAILTNESINNSTVKNLLFPIEFESEIEYFFDNDDYEIRRETTSTGVRSHLWRINNSNYSEYNNSFSSFYNSLFYNKELHVESNSKKSILELKIKIGNLLREHTSFPYEKVHLQFENLGSEKSQYYIDKAKNEIKNNIKIDWIASGIIDRLDELQSQIKTQELQLEIFQKYFKKYINVVTKRIDKRRIRYDSSESRMYDKIFQIRNTKENKLENDFVQILEEIDVLNLINFNSFLSIFHEKTNFDNTIKPGFRRSREYNNQQFTNRIKISDFITQSNDEILKKFDFNLDSTKEIEDYYLEKARNFTDYIEAGEFVSKRNSILLSKKRELLRQSTEKLGLNILNASKLAHRKKDYTFISQLDAIRERDLINRKSQNVFQHFKCFECSKYHVALSSLKKIEKTDTAYIESLTAELQDIEKSERKLRKITRPKNFRAMHEIEPIEKIIVKYYRDTLLREEIDTRAGAMDEIIDNKVKAFLITLNEFKETLPLLINIIEEETNSLWAKAIYKDSIHVKSFGYATRDKTLTQLLDQALENIFYKTIHHKKIKKDPFLIWKLFKIFNIFVENDDNIQFDNFLYSQAQEISPTNKKLINNILSLSTIDNQSIEYDKLKNNDESKRINFSDTFLNHDYVIAKYKNNLANFEMLQDTLTDSIKILRLDNDKENVRNETFTPNTPVGIFGDMTSNVLTENKNIKFINPVITNNKNSDSIELNHKIMLSQDCFEDTIQKFASKWMNYILHSDINLSVTQESKNEIDIKINDDYLHNVGSGVRKILQVVTAVLSSQNQTLFLEEIEQNLHASAQARILDLLLYSSIKNDTSFVVETHSDHLINRLRLRKAEFIQQFSQKVNWKVYFANLDKDKNTEFIDLKINNKGMFENEEIPKGFFDQPQNDIVSLLNIQSKNS